MKNTLKTLLAVTAFALAIGNSAQARLGWSIEECQQRWGQPLKVGYDSDVDYLWYNFRVNDQLGVTVRLIKGTVASLCYWSQDKNYLSANLQTLLEMNGGANGGNGWESYQSGDNHYLGTWRIALSDGTMVRYASLLRKPDGYYNLDIGTALFNKALLESHQKASTNSAPPLNV
jgi:hypothetical protein